MLADKRKTPKKNIGNTRTCAGYVGYRIKRSQIHFGVICGVYYASSVQENHSIKQIITERVIICKPLTEVRVTYFFVVEVVLILQTP